MLGLTIICNGTYSSGSSCVNGQRMFALRESPRDVPFRGRMSVVSRSGGRQDPGGLLCTRIGPHPGRGLRRSWDSYKLMKEKNSAFGASVSSKVMVVGQNRRTAHTCPTTLQINLNVASLANRTLQARVQNVAGSSSSFTYLTCPYPIDEFSTSMALLQSDTHHSCAKV